jgi:hypothetical protein
MSVTCYSFPAGLLYITLTGGGGASTSTAFIQISTTTCAGGKTGVGCNANLIAYNASVPLTNGSLPAWGGSPAIFPSTVYYIPFAVNSTIGLNITVAAITGSGSLTYRVGTFPFDDDISGQGQGFLYSDDRADFSTTTTVTLYLTPQDTVLGNTVYFAISNEDANPLSYSISASSIVPSTTTGITSVSGTTNAAGTTNASGTGTTHASGTTTTTASGTTTTTTASGTTTTGTTTTKVTTTTGTSTGTATSSKVTTGSGANMLVVPVVLLASLLLALLF